MISFAVIGKNRVTKVLNDDVYMCRNKQGAPPRTCRLCTLPLINIESVQTPVQRSRKYTFFQVFSAAHASPRAVINSSGAGAGQWPCC